MTCHVKLTKRQFLIDIGYEKIPVEGQIHKNVHSEILNEEKEKFINDSESAKR